MNSFILVVIITLLKLFQSSQDNCTYDNGNLDLSILSDTIIKYQDSTSLYYLYSPCNPLISCGSGSYGKNSYLTLSWVYGTDINCAFFTLGKYHFTSL